MTRRPYDHGDELAELRVLEPAARTRDELHTAMRAATLVVFVLASWGLLVLLALAGLLFWKVAT